MLKTRMGVLATSMLLCSMGGVYAQQNTGKAVLVHTFNELYSAKPIVSGDSTYRFECYEASGRVINPLVAGNDTKITKMIKVVSWKGSVPQGSYVPEFMRKEEEYELIENGEWYATELATQTHRKYKVLPEIVKRDTIVLPPNKMGTGGTHVFQYHKVVELKMSSEELHQHEHNHGHDHHH